MSLFSFPWRKSNRSAPLCRTRPHFDTLEDRTTPATLTKTVVFTNALPGFEANGQDPNFDLTGLVDQFDPALGQLQSVTIAHEGSITSTIQIENISKSFGDTITSTVGGNLTFKAPGVNDVLTISQNV